MLKKLPLRMHFSDMPPLKIALLDLYEGAANQGMRCIREIVNQFSEQYPNSVQFDEFDVRQHLQVPDLNYDVYISSGGPGSPLDSEGSAWEQAYFGWLDSVLCWNSAADSQPKKHVFFICHSFQLACRFFQVGQVTKRKSTSFGVFPIHVVEGGNQELVFQGMKDPFYAVDSRDYQVIEPNYAKMDAIGATLLAIEKDRPHVNLERAMMAIRFNEYMIGTQFHPEADAIGMSLHLQTEDRKQVVIENHGYEKWKSMIEHLNDPDKILYTYSHILPNFLRQSVEQLSLATL